MLPRPKLPVGTGSRMFSPTGVKIFRSYRLVVSSLVEETSDLEERIARLVYDIVCSLSGAIAL